MADDHKLPLIDARSLAVHEVSHAVAGICLGRVGLLEWVNIIETDERQGGCKWNLENHDGIPGEDFAVRFAGPIGQVVFLPDSFGSEISHFRSTINQPRERLKKCCVEGWLSSDLIPFRNSHPRQLFTLGDEVGKMSLDSIESRMRDLLMRPTVTAAVLELSKQLNAEREIGGKVAEKLIQSHLTRSDFVERSFLLVNGDRP